MGIREALAKIVENVDLCPTFAELAGAAAPAAASGHTLVPLRMYFKEGRAKIELAIAHGKQMHDKRQALKKADAQRDIRRALSARRK